MSAPKPNVLHNIDACVFGEQRADSKNLLLPSAIKTMAKYMGGVATNASFLWSMPSLFYKRYDSYDNALYVITYYIHKSTCLGCSASLLTIGAKIIGYFGAIMAPAFKTWAKL